MRKVAARDALGRVAPAAAASRGGRTLVSTLPEQPRDDRARHAVIIHEQYVHLVGGGARHGRPTSLADVTRTADAFPRVPQNHPPPTEPRAGVPRAFARFVARADRTRVGACSVAPAARLAIPRPRRENVLRELSVVVHRANPADRREKRTRGTRRHDFSFRSVGRLKNIEC